MSLYCLCFKSKALWEIVPGLEYIGTLTIYPQYRADNGSIVGARTTNKVFNPLATGVSLGSKSEPFLKALFGLILRLI